MSGLTLVIGNRNYSSWSLRAWLALKHCAAPFSEDHIALDQIDSAARIRAYSPAGRVPVLVDRDLTIWDSLAVCEYLAERFPAARLWPTDVAARAMARSVSAEMHAGFTALRAELPMNIRAYRTVQTSVRANADIDRIVAVWASCLGLPGPDRTDIGAGSRTGAGADAGGDDGGWLFGRFSIADAMYAPVVLRFRTYRIDVPPVAAAYMARVLADPALQAWIGAALKETAVIEADEAGVPV